MGETGADEQGGGSDRGGKPKQNRKPEPPLPPDHPKTQKNGKQGNWGKRRNCGNNGTGRKHGNRPLGPNRDNGGGRGEGGNMGSGAPALNTAMRIDLCDRNKEAESQRPGTRPIVAISVCEKGYSQTARDEEGGTEMQARKSTDARDREMSRGHPGQTHTSVFFPPSPSLPPARKPLLLDTKPAFWMRSPLLSWMRSPLLSWNENCWCGGGWGTRKGGAPLISADQCECCKYGQEWQGLPPTASANWEKSPVRTAERSGGQSSAMRDKSSVSSAERLVLVERGVKSRSYFRSNRMAWTRVVGTSICSFLVPFFSLFSACYLPTAPEDG